MAMTAVMTQKQRAAIQALEAAREQGCSLTQYARKRGLDVQRIYAILHSLRQRGLLPRSADNPSRFVAVKLGTHATAVPVQAGSSGAVCRIVHGSGWVIECLHWPAPSWVKGVAESSPDAAA
jgi:predicted transcriptional regulator